MTAKEYLERLKEMNDKIDSDIHRYEQLKAGAFGSRGIDYSKDRVMTSPVDMMCETVCDYIDLNNQINAAIDEFADRKEAAIKQIGQLDDIIERQVLLCRYIEFLSINRTMKRLCIGYEKLKNAEESGLLHFEKIHSEMLSTIC